MKKSFSLIELLVAMGIFTIVGTIALSLFVSLTENRRRIEVANAVQTETRILIDRLSREIRRSMIDYGEYYNRLVVPPDAAGSDNRFGDNIDEYAGLFFNPGSDGDLGAQCNDGNPAPCADGAVILTSTIDVDTGQNPSVAPGNLPEDADAFCNNGIPGQECNIMAPADYTQTQLYLLDPTGTQKTVIGLENLGRPIATDPVEFSLSMTRMNGEDADGNGSIEAWSCGEEFNCNDLDTLANEFEWNVDDANATLERRDISNIREDARPITPLNLSIDRFLVDIVPFEDPLRAWAENAMQVFPSVRIRMQIRPSAAIARGMQFAPLDIQMVIMPEQHRRISAGEFTGG